MSTMAVIGTAARIMSTTKASAAASLPMTIAPGRIGVLIRRSRVCFSRSRLICPAVKPGAMKQIRMSWKIERRVKIDLADEGRCVRLAADAEPPAVAGVRRDDQVDAVGDQRQQAEVDR